MKYVVVDDVHRYFASISSLRLDIATEAMDFCALNTEWAINGALNVSIVEKNLCFAYTYMSVYTKR